MHLHQCKACGYQFNAKTGLSAKKAIRIYRTAAWAIAGVALIGYFLSHR
jgi:transposase-like protein